MEALIDRIPTLKGDVMVKTKIRNLFFLKRPHTIVIPEGFNMRLGFQVHYNTSDPGILAEFQDFYVMCVAAGGFEALFMAVKTGVVDFPDEKKHLARYVTAVVWVIRTGNGALLSRKLSWGHPFALAGESPLGFLHADFLLKYFQK